MARKPGSMAVGSLQHWRSTFGVGEVRWKQTTLEHYDRDQRALSGAQSRRPEAIKDWRFSVGLFTAVSASKAGCIEYLIRVERTA